MTGPERHREPRTERRERPHAGSAFGNGVMRSAQGCVLSEILDGESEQGRHSMLKRFDVQALLPKSVLLPCARLLEALRPLTSQGQHQTEQRTQNGECKPFATDRDR